jgi:hypothetical protein
MVRKSAVLALLLLPLLAAQAPAPSTENVTVTGTKSREVIDSFVKSFATPTRMTGKMARWETPICPYAIGVQPAANDFVIKRLKEIAAQAGAPVSSDAKCQFNIEIIFTKTPQALLDSMKKDQPGLLGYYDSSEERDRLATVTRPIQGWYTTATQDLRGRTEIDSSRTTNHGLGTLVQLPCSMFKGRSGGAGPNAICSGYLPYARVTNVTGMRLNDGVHSQFHHIVIVADTGKLSSYELGAASDYIAMLALTQLSSPSVCQQLPSIANLLADNCTAKTGALTSNDAAYLRGLYQANSGMEAKIQQNEIVNQMEKTLTAQ